LVGIEAPQRCNQEGEGHPKAPSWHRRPKSMKGFHPELDPFWHPGFDKFLDPPLLVGDLNQLCLALSSSMVRQSRAGREMVKASLIWPATFSVLSMTSLVPLSIVADVSLTVIDPCGPEL
jgi:hypothetical protein